MLVKQTKNSHILILDSNKIARIESFVYGAARDNSAYYAPVPSFSDKSWVVEQSVLAKESQYLTLNKTYAGDYYVKVESGNAVSKSTDYISWMPINKVDWCYDGVVPPTAEYTFGLYFLKYLDKQIKVLANTKDNALGLALKDLNPSIVQTVKHMDTVVNPQYENYTKKLNTKPF